MTGKADEWDLPKDRSDCEDFAILKKSELIRLGWPRSALLLTVARRGGEGHTVLTVRTSEGDLVLDNRTLAIRDWSRTPYRYFARQSQSNGKLWERIGSARQIANPPQPPHRQDYTQPRRHFFVFAAACSAH
jgi:predicted transglutaminase-like cysteine proteinase